MRLARWLDATGAEGFGTVSADGALATPLQGRVGTFAQLLAQGSSTAAQPGDPRLDTADLTWLPPVTGGAKVFCVGFNFAAHAKESEREVPTHPTLFLRFPDSFVGAGTDVARPPESPQLDWEGEVALVIGRGGRRIPVGSALEHVAGYTCMAENSVRDWQFHSPQATAGKNWAGSGALGPWVVTRDESGDGPFDLTTRLNGDVVQSDTTANLVFSAAEVIAYVSTFTPLRPGDVIATGTPSGVGARMDPPRWLVPGDEVTVEVAGVGVLTNRVADEVLPPS